MFYGCVNQEPSALYSNIPLNDKSIDIGNCQDPHPYGPNPDTKHEYGYFTNICCNSGCEDIFKTFLNARPVSLPENYFNSTKIV